MNGLLHFVQRGENNGKVTGYPLRNLFSSQSYYPLPIQIFEAVKLRFARRRSTVLISGKDGTSLFLLADGNNLRDRLSHLAAC